MSDYNPFSLENKTVLVTGASSGIGRAAAVECARMGARVIVTGRNEERLQLTLQQVITSGIGGGGGSVRCDLTNEAELTNLVESAPLLQGAVINAGVERLVPVRYIRRGDFESMLQTNTVSSVALLQKLLKHKKIADGASVVFTSSVSALGKAAAGNAMYAASKGAVSSFVRVAALELAGRGVRVNAVCPGEVKTGMIAANCLMTGDPDSGAARYPLGRYGEPRDIALAMVYLLSDASGWVTGTNMVVDGGMSVT